ncbi:MAG: sigma-70 family RNA polymerase sigma factor, partial [Candidatus Thiodiazotropha sp.]
SSGEVGTTKRRRQIASRGITWPAKQESVRSSSPGTAPAHPPMGDLPVTQGFWAIWVEHQEYLSRHSLRWMSNNADDAADALSNAMLLAQRKFPKYADAITNTRHWLARLVHNVCMDHHRASNRLQGIESELWRDVLEVHALYPSRQIEQPDQEVINQELLMNLQSGLQNLPVSQREPLILRCVYDLPYSDIAIQMNLSECTVRKRVQLARDKLRHLRGAFY